MYFEFACSKCQKKLKVREENIGGKVRCPHCHTTQLVEGPSTVDQDSPFNFVVNDTSAAGTPGASAGSPSTAAGPSISTSAAPRPAAGPKPHAGHHQASSATEVSPWLTGGVGFVLFVLIYMVLFPFRGKYVGDLFYDRGWVNFAETLCFTWSIAILFFKWRKLSAQQDSMLFDLLPTEVAKDITVKSVEKFAKHIQSLPVQPSSSFLVNRVIRGLEHFRILRNSSEVAGRMQTQSDVDANAVDSSYAIIKVFVWAIPILGFIGTVQGIGASVANFSTAMANAGDISALKDSFGSVTSGLGTAFDTTLLALVLSMFIMFPMTSLLKGEQDLLNWVDEYTNENLLKRLKDDTGPTQVTASGIDPKALQAAIDAALTPHHAEFKAWTKKLETIGETLSQQVATGWTKADEQLQQRHGQVIKQLQKSSESASELTDRLKSISERQSETMTQLAERTIQAQSDVGESMQHTGHTMQEAAESIQRYFGALEEGLGTLNRVLGDLGEKQVVVNVQQQPAPIKAGWSLFGRRNGR
ncbi:MAG: MotA/TolQ/ExbB proton channel family protein [Planctomycetaceae bacterium]